jgi:hypothetical protein
LDADVRRDLRGLQKETAETVARHLVAAGSLVDEDPEQALAHARYARYRASRIALVREAAGIAAYHAGEWSEALGELRAARRMGGGPGHLAVMADNLAAAGREPDAVEWFMHAADADETAETDAAARLAELTGEPLPDDDASFEDDDVHSDAVAEEAPTSIDDEPSVGDGPTDDASVVDDLDDETAVDDLDDETAVEDVDDEATVDADGVETAADEVPSSAADPVVAEAVVPDADVVDAPDHEPDPPADDR